MHQTLADALAERGYATLTPVQEAVTDPALATADLLVSAQTGSGKTVGFGLAIAPTLLADEPRFGPAALPLALVIAPTRELALQVMRELAWLYARAGVRMASCVGGMDMRDERRTLDRGAHIVVGTPGRLRDHLQRGSLDLGECRAVVLDEADEMLDLGFREDLEALLAAAPVERRTLMFSATVPPAIAELARTFQRDARRVTAGAGGRQHADISYQAVRVAERDAEPAIINLLRFHDAENAIVFANTRAAVARLTARLSNRGMPVVSLSGELSQDQRSHALQAMRDGRARVCVATDVAARGIDLPNLDLVVHAELPSNGETLLHRSGRTGRAGRKGTSVLIVPPKAAKKAERLLKTARLNADWTVPPTAAEILRQDEQRLLTDPLWDEAVGAEDMAFARRLLTEQSPEAVAAAYLRLWRSRHSAPEDLSPPDARPARTERPAFGPSAWFALSVGRDRNAEPRWLLPLLCRSGNLDRESIGAIRVQETESYVEVLEAAADGFLETLGSAMTLEDGVTVRRLDGPPELRGGRPQRPPREGRPERPARAPRPPRFEREQQAEPERPIPEAPPAADPTPLTARIVERRPAADPAPEPLPESDAPRKERKPKPSPKDKGKPKWAKRARPEGGGETAEDAPRKPRLKRPADTAPRRGARKPDPGSTRRGGEDPPRRKR